MKGTPATRIAILSFASAVAVGALFAWMVASGQLNIPSVANIPAPAPEQVPSSPSGAPAPAPVTAAVESLKTLETLIDPRAGRTDRAPAFDVVRIEPSGESVIAGRAPPGAGVELLRGDDVHERTLADPSGNFVLVPKPLPPGNYNLTLRATAPNGDVSTSKDSVVVALQSGNIDKPVVAHVAPDKPAVVLSKPAAETSVALAIDAVEGDTGGGLYVSGRSAPGTNVRLYLNGAYIASATASAEGRLAFAIRSGVKPGDYRVRLDQVTTSGKVESRAEVSFNATRMAAAATSPTSGPKPATSAPASAPAAGSPAPTATPKISVPIVSAPTAAPSSLASVSPAADAPNKESRSVQAESKPPTMPLQSTPHMVANSPAPPEPVARQIADTSPGIVQPPAGQGPSVSIAASEPAVAAATPPPSATPGDRANVVIVPSVDTTVVNRGDHLWRISKFAYGNGARYSVIYAANRAQIRDPDLIYPGQIFVLPKALPGR